MKLGKETSERKRGRGTGDGTSETENEERDGEKGLSTKVIVPQELFHGLRGGHADDGIRVVPNTEDFHLRERAKARRYEEETDAAHLKRGKGGQRRTQR